MAEQQLADLMSVGWLEVDILETVFLALRGFLGKTIGKDTCVTL